MQISIDLNIGEQKMVEWLTKARTKIDIDHETKPTLWGEYDNTKEDRFRSSLLGFGGEFAFCKLFNVYPDTSIEYRSGGCDVLWKGLRLDVKTVGTYDGSLMVKKGREDKADLWVLMYGDYPHYYFKGYTTTSDLMRNLVDLKKTSGPTYVMKQEDLFWLDQTPHLSYEDLCPDVQL